MAALNLSGNTMMRCAVSSRQWSHATVLRDANTTRYNNSDTYKAMNDRGNGKGRSRMLSIMKVSGRRSVMGMISGSSAGAILLSCSPDHGGSVADAKLISKPDVYFLSPGRNEDVKSPVQLRMAAKGALRLVDKRDDMRNVVLSDDDIPGYLVVLIDDKFAPYKAGVKIPTDSTHIHLEDGSTTYSLPLETGRHTVSVHFVNGGNAKSFGPKNFQSISINVVQ